MSGNFISALGHSRVHWAWGMLLGFLALVIASTLGFAQSPVPGSKPDYYPDWWFQRDVIMRVNPGNPTPVWPGDYPSSNDKAALTVGQLKQFTAQAYAEIKARYPNQPWTTSGTPAHALEQFVFDWFDSYPAQPKAAGSAFRAANQGQLKNAAKYVFDVLAAIGYEAGPDVRPIGWTGVYPWTSVTTDDVNKGMVNIGQAKHLFSFDLNGPVGEPNSDTDPLPDGWELFYFKGLGQAAGGDYDNDGVLNNIDARPNDPGVGAMTISITTPANGSSVP